MSESEPKQPDARRFRLAWIVAAVSVLYLLFGVLVLPWILEAQLLRIIEDRTGRPASLEAIRVDPIRFRVSLIGFEWPRSEGGSDVRTEDEPSGPGPVAGVRDARAIVFESLIVDFRPLGFLRADLALDELVWVAPRVVAEFDSGGELNLSRLRVPMRMGEGSEASGNGTGSEAPPDPVIEIGSIRIERGAFVFRDVRRSPIFELEITPVDLEIEPFSTRPGGSSFLSFGAHLGETTGLTWRGTIDFAPFRSEGHIALSALDLRIPWRYAEDALRFEVPTGWLSIGTRYDFSLEAGPTLLVEEAAVEVRDLEVLDRAEGRSALVLPHLSVDGIRAEWREAGLALRAVEEVRVESGRVSTGLDADGRLRLTELFSPVPSQAEAVADGGAAMQNGSPTGGDSGAEPVGGKMPAWHVDRIRVADFAVEFEDRTAVRPVPIRLSSLRLRTDRHRTEGGASYRFDLEAGVGESGRIRVRGPFVVDPFEATLAVRGEGIALAGFAPYLEEVARLDIRSGALSMDLDLLLTDRGNDPLSVSSKGNLRIDDFATRDRSVGEDFLAWRRVGFDGIDFGPDHLVVDAISVDRPRLRLVFGREDGSNLDAILGSRAVEASKVVEVAVEVVTAEEDGARKIEIGRIEVDDLALDLLDRGVEPAFRLGLDAFSGRIEALSTTSGTPARLEFEGRIDEAGPIRVEGSIDPFSPDPFAEIRLAVSDLSMPILSPYSVRYVGYRIDRGKLGLALDYRLEGTTLAGENHISIDRFELGEKVASEQATALPVPLAVALSRDPSGRIEIDLPLRGKLDDPGFDPIALFGKAVVQLVTRVVTTPFSIVDGLVGGRGEDLAGVFFPAGSQALSSEEEARLAALARALAPRSAIRVEIRGTADPDVDGSAMGIGSGEDARARLERLALARARAVREALFGTGEIAADRIFVVDVEIGPGATAAGVPARLSLRLD